MTDHAAIVRDALHQGALLMGASLDDIHQGSPSLALAALDALEVEAKKAWEFEGKMLKRAVAAEAERDEWKREAELSKWPKEAAQEYHLLKADYPAVVADRDRLREALKATTDPSSSWNLGLPRYRIERLRLFVELALASGVSGGREATEGEA